MPTNNARRDLSELFEEDDSLTRVIIPQSGPLQLRNNCNSGRWQMGNQECGDKLRFIPLGFKKFFGDLGITYSTHWLQLFLIPIAGSSEDIPLDMLCCTYLKTESYSNFINLQKMMEGRLGKNWHKSTWEAKFSKRQKSGDQPMNYYAIEFDVQPIDVKNIFDADYPHLVKLLETHQNMKANGDSIYNHLSDPQGVTNMMEVTDNTTFALHPEHEGNALPEAGEMRSASVDENGLIDSPL